MANQANAYVQPGAFGKKDATPQLDDDTQSSRAQTGPQKPFNFFENKCKELQAEIDELHKLIDSEHGTDSVVASYIEQVK